MTVKELIEFLQKLPENDTVKIVKTYQDEWDELQLHDEYEELGELEILKLDGEVIIGGTI